MKKTISLFCILFAFTHGFSQQITQTIRGTVIDQDAGSPLTGATIVVEGTNPLGWYTYKIVVKHGQTQYYSFLY